MAAVSSQEDLDARAAFLDLAEPDLSGVAAELAAAGHRRAVVVPLPLLAVSQDSGNTGTGPPRGRRSSITQLVRA